MSNNATYLSVHELLSERQKLAIGRSELREVVAEAPIVGGLIAFSDLETEIEDRELALHALYALTMPGVAVQLDLEISCIELEASCNRPSIVLI